MDFRVAPIEKVTRFAAVMVKVVPTLTSAGKLKVVNAAKDAATDVVIVASDVNVTVVAKAQTGAKLPATVAKDGNAIVVNVAKVGA